MSQHLENRIAADVLFGVVFGRLSAHDFNVFAEHDGPLGLKYAMLDEIVARGLTHMPTLKGRLMLDLSRRLLYEAHRLSGWTPEVRSMLRALNINDPRMPSGMSAKALAMAGPVPSLIAHCVYCKKEFGRDLLAQVDLDKPAFYSVFEWKRMLDIFSDIPGVSPDLLDEPDALFVPGR